MKRVFWMVLCGVWPLWVSSAESGALELPELRVRGDSAARAPSASLTPGLAGALAGPGLRLAPQGGGAQADLSIRGSSFSGAGLALGGLSLRQPQTEHFHAEMPLPLEWLSEVRLLTGLEQARDVSGHLVGSLAAEFAPIATGGMASAGLSTGGGHDERVVVSRTLEGTPWAGALFLSNRDLPGRDYGHNTAETRSGGLHLQYRTAEDQLDATLAVQDKAFGARGFYGVAPTLLASEETTDVLLIGSWRHDLAEPGDFLRLSASTRRFADEYVLNDTDPDAYRNDHRTRVSSGSADGRLSVVAVSVITWRVVAEDERIDSDGVLQGAPSDGLGRHARQRLGLLVLPFHEIGPLTLEAGGQVLFFSDGEAMPLALAGGRWAVSEGQEAYVTISETVRQPSFTELDYESPASLGNRGLESEESREVEAGLRSRWSPAVRTRVAVFRRDTEHTVDWLRLAPGGRWLATDVGDVVTRGLEAEVAWEVAETLRLTAFGEVLRKHSGADFEASRYVFDYPEERLGLGLSWRPAAWCEVSVTQAVLRYAANPARGGDRTGVEADLEVVLRPPRRTDLSLTLACLNLFDDDLELYPGQRRAARTALARLTFAW